MKLLDGPDDVAQVFDDVYGVDLIKRAVSERIGEVVQVHQHVGARTWIAIDADRARPLVNAAADVQDCASAHVSHPSSVSRDYDPAGSIAARMDWLDCGMRQSGP